MRTSAAIEVTAGVGLVATVVFFLSTFFLTPDPAAGPATDDDIGSSSEPSGSHLILALSTNCSICERSSKFHWSLTEAANISGARISAIFVEDRDIGQEYLLSKSITSDIVDSGSYLRHVRGTPTVLLTNSAGQVVKTWAGLLTPERMKEVARSVGIENEFLEVVERSAENIGPTFYGAPLISAFEMPNSSSSNHTIIDTRPSSIFRDSHLVGAINIPLDELEARLPVEVPAENQIIHFCNLDIGCEDLSRSTAQLSHCALAVQVLQELRPNKVVVLKETITTLKRLGGALEVTGDES